MEVIVPVLKTSFEASNKDAEIAALLFMSKFKFVQFNNWESMSKEHLAKYLEFKATPLNADLLIQFRQPLLQMSTSLTERLLKIIISNKKFNNEEYLKNFWDIMLFTFAGTRVFFEIYQAADNPITFLINKQLISNMLYGINREDYSMLLTGLLIDPSITKHVIDIEERALHVFIKMI